MYKAPRGTFDIYGQEHLLRDEVVNVMFDVVKMYGFSPITTPIFEESKLFIRSVGDSSDIVNKEIYEFSDKKGRSLALRPELTAPIMRSYIENKMYAQDPIKKLCYYGPSFRYERPQAGRYRQFYQFGVESMGIKNPIYDAQMIIMALHILEQLGINNFSLHINTLGSNEDRANYNKALKDYFSNHVDNLCEDCKHRLDTNPLRILDCKIDGDSDIIKNAPKLQDYLSEDSLSYYQTIKQTLDSLEITYIEDEKLVRGLDYYNDIVFEIISDSDDAKNTLVGGGRYDNLCSQLGGENISSIGFAIGVERIINTLKAQNENILENYNQDIDVYFSTSSDEERIQALRIMNQLRDGLVCECNYVDKSYKANLKQALKHNAIFLISFEDDSAIIRNLKTKEEEKMSERDLLNYFNKLR